MYNVIQCFEMLYLYRALIIMCDIQEHGVGNARHQRPETGLKKSPHRFPSVPVNQPALLVTVSCAHRLYNSTKNDKLFKKNVNLKCPYYAI